MDLDYKKIRQFDLRIRDICEDIDSTKYPETKKDLCEYIEMVDEYDGDQLNDMRMLMVSLYEADSAKVFEKRIGKLLIDFYKYDAQLGEPMSMNNLGSVYQNGRLGKRYYEEAIKYYQMSDKNGCRIASENLGYTYYYGLGTEIDYEKAYYYFSKAAMAGRYIAMYKIGDMFRYGLYVEKDLNATRDSYLRAAKLIKDKQETPLVEYGSLYTRLGDMYYEGLGVDVDIDKAYTFYQNAQKELYTQTLKGDPWHQKMLEHVADRLSNINRKIKKTLPEFEWSN